MDHLVDIIILGIGSYQGQIVSLVQLVFHFVRYAKLFSVYSFESLIFKFPLLKVIEYLLTRLSNFIYSSYPCLNSKFVVKEGVGVTFRIIHS